MWFHNGVQGIQMYEEQLEQLSTDSLLVLNGQN